MTDTLTLSLNYGHFLRSFGDASANFPDNREVSIGLPTLAREARIKFAKHIAADDPGLDPAKIDALPRIHVRVTGLKEHEGKTFWVSRLREGWL